MKTDVSRHPMRTWARAKRAVVAAAGALLTSWSIGWVTPSVAAEQIIYLHNDVFGNPLVATDANGDVRWTEHYRPFGAPQLLQAKGSANRIGFAGKAYDRDTQLSYFGARYYDPIAGRFYGIDPKEADPNDIHSFNRYAYGNNNPYRYVDPDGNSPLDVIFLAYDVAKLGVAVYSGGDVKGAAVDVGLSLLGVLSPVPGTGQALKIAKVADKAAEVTRVADRAHDATLVSSVGNLRASGQKDAHHVIQDAAVRNLPGYNTNAAPGIQLAGLSNVTGTPHNLATAVQRQAGGGTYAAERRIGYKAMRRAGASETEARTAIRKADEYFGSIGVSPSTPTRVPGNRPNAD